MTTQIKLIILIFFLSGGILCAQESDIAKALPNDLVQNYLSVTKEYAALFNGKIEMPFDNRQFVNHAYLGTDQYVQGTLCYNDVIYRDIFMRLDLFRDELTVYSTDKPYHIVLEYEKFNYAIFGGFTIIPSTVEAKPGERYLELIYDGSYPVIKKYRVTVKTELSNTDISRSFTFQKQYFVSINEIAYPIKNKNALLRLFPDRKKELNEYAKLHRFNFRKQFERSIVALINHYENLEK
jgi:hypothetical protein